MLLHAQPEFNIGWQAPRGPKIVYDQFAETFEVVSSELNSTFTITPYALDMDLQAAANNGSLDFVYGGPTLIYCIILAANIQPLATLASYQDGLVASVLSGSIVVAERSDITDIRQLKGATIGVGQFTGLTTFQSESQLLLNNNVSIFRDCKALVEYPASPQILAAVLAGAVDAGFVQTAIQPDGLRVLNATVVPDQPIPSSTPTYSAQVFAATQHISEELRTRLVSALIDLDQEVLKRGGYAGWNVPRSFVDIRRLGQATGLLNASGEKCNDMSQGYNFVVCPPGFERDRDLDIRNSCRSKGFACPADARICICSPCVAIRYPKHFGSLSLGALLGVIIGTVCAVVFLAVAALRYCSLYPPIIPWEHLHIHSDTVLGQAKKGRVLQAKYGSRLVVLKRAFARNNTAGEVYFDGAPPRAGKGYTQYWREHPANLLWNLVGVRGSFDQKCAAVAAQTVPDHPNVLKVYGVTTGDDGCEVVAVMDFAPKGTLLELLSSPSVEMTTASKLRLALDAALGLQYLHSLQPPEVGRKLRTHHLLLNDNYVCVLNSCFDKRLKGSGRSRLYMAPELLRGGDMTTATDMYAFGMLLWEIIHRQQVYESEESDDIAYAVQFPGAEVMRPHITSQDITAAVQNLMVACWAEDPLQRPTCTQAVNVLMTKASESFTGDLILETRQQDVLLKQMLPDHVVRALKNGRTPSFRKFEMVTIYFSDIQGFTSISSSQEPEDVMAMLDDLFGKFDALCLKLELMKVETIGDALSSLYPLPLLCPCICLNAALSITVLLTTIACVAFSKRWGLTMSTKSIVDKATYTLLSS